MSLQFLAFGHGLHSLRPNSGCLADPENPENSEKPRNNEGGPKNPEIHKNYPKNPKNPEFLD